MKDAEIAATDHVTTIWMVAAHTDSNSEKQFLETVVRDDVSDIFMTMSIKNQEENMKNKRILVKMNFEAKNVLSIKLKKTKICL